MKNVRIEIQVNAIRGDESEMIYNSVTFLRVNAVDTTDIVSLVQLDAVARAVGAVDCLSVGIILEVDERKAVSLLRRVAPEKLVPSVCIGVARKAIEIGLSGLICETR